MRAFEHVKKEGKIIPLFKGGERFFLKVFELDSGFSSDLWVFDTYPGEKFKGLPIRLDHLSARASSFKELIAGYRRMGFRVLHPYHKYPKWVKENLIEDKINTMYHVKHV